MYKNNTESINLSKKKKLNLPPLFKTLHLPHILEIKKNYSSFYLDIKLIVDGKEFHQKCFACFNCSIQLDKVYGSKDGEYYCEMCYVQKFGKKCAACGKVILGEGLRFGEDSYHR